MDKKSAIENIQTVIDDILSRDDWDNTCDENWTSMINSLEDVMEYVKSVDSEK